MQSTEENFPPSEVIKSIPLSLNTFGLAGSAAQALEYIDLLAATCCIIFLAAAAMVTVHREICAKEKAQNAKKAGDKT